MTRHSGISAALCAALLVLAAVMPAPATAASRLERLDQRHDLLGWEAVGRIDIGKSAFCTGVLIAPELVLTAAHCVFDSNARAVAPAALTFRAGLHDGQWIASRSVRRIVAHADYDPRGGTSAANIRADAALLELETPVPSSTAAPFALHEGAAKGDRVSVVSYGRGRDAAPSWQRDCGVLERGGGLLAFDCDVTFGSSGAPVFLRQGNRARVLSLISSGRRDKGKSLSWGMDLSGVVARLKSDLRAAPSTAASRPVTVRRIGVGDGRAGTGAKFVRSGQ